MSGSELGDWLQLFVKPCSKTMEKTATVADNQMGFPRCLVDFGKNTEVAEWIRNCFNGSFDAGKVGDSNQSTEFSVEGTQCCSDFRDSKVCLLKRQRLMS